MPHAHFAERGQHRTDVLEEGGVGSDDHHAAASQPLAEGIEQPRGSVQTDGRLAGAWSALDADARRGVGADQDILLGLDRRDDVAHRPLARPLDLALQDGAAPDLLGRVAQVFVFVGRETPPVDAKATPQLHAHRLGP